MKRRTVLTLACAGAIGRAFAATPVRVRVETEFGNFVIQVDPDVAPVTVANFLRYVDEGYLEDALFYRLVSLANQPANTPHKIQVVQWGMRLPDGVPPPFPAIKHETTRDTGLKHKDGTVSMARAAPGTAAGEFFICIGDQPELDFGGRRHPDGQGFAAFGQVVEGMDVVRKIHAQAKPQQFLEEPYQAKSVKRL
ncbi:peptidylprolyl isomerase [Ramlibacter albus]|uniref:peptidylprolyl isomerase n=1 Tax=Ramlibacter albus TaxID=2079448 RepID=A0A923S4J7_9BURK|nr:peptidylprolyl isomerase [Ramlibacter albus]MBC5766988.1 peptidylprolyl isomerase [Ramlibacter albus]